MCRILHSKEHCYSNCIQGHPSGLRLHYVDSDLVVTVSDLLCLGSSAILAELACRVGNRVDLPNQSQQNIVADLTDHPVRTGLSKCISLNLTLLLNLVEMALLISVVAVVKVKTRLKHLGFRVPRYPSAHKIFPS